MSEIKEQQEILKKIVSEKDKVADFRRIDNRHQGAILIALPRQYSRDIINRLTDEEIITVLNNLDPDEVTDILQIIDSQRSAKITIKLDESIKEKVQFLLKFDPSAAAGLMSLDYIHVEENSKFEDLKNHIIEHEKKTGKFPTVLVTKDGLLKGELPGHILAFYKPKESIKNYVQKIPSVKYDLEDRKVVDLFMKHPHNKVVVLNDDESILGIIHSDDILRLIEKHSKQDLYGFAGVNREEDILDSAVTKVKYRYKWLIINLGTAFLAASVVGLFQQTISKFVLLAVYMPIVAGMGGNAGTQTLAVTIRGLVLREVNLSTSKRIITNEMFAGGINGLINGVIVAAVATFFNQNPALGLIIGIAMVINLINAGLFGALIPMIMKVIGKDPASSATIFITTATDVFGFFIFLGLAQIIL